MLTVNWLDTPTFHCLHLYFQHFTCTGHFSVQGNCRDRSENSCSCWHSKIVSCALFCFHTVSWGWFCKTFGITVRQKWRKGKISVNMVGAPIGAKLNLIRWDKAFQLRKMRNHTGVWRPAVKRKCSVAASFSYTSALHQALRAMKLPRHAFLLVLPEIVRRCWDRIHLPKILATPTESTFAETAAADKHLWDYYADNV